MSATKPVLQAAIQQIESVEQGLAMTRDLTTITPEVIHEISQHFADAPDVHGVVDLRSLFLPALIHICEIAGRLCLNEQR
jgi:hypothetical protein